MVTELNLQELQQIEGGGWVGAVIGAAVGSLGGPFTALAGAYVGHQIEEALKAN